LGIREQLDAGVVVVDHKETGFNVVTIGGNLLAEVVVVVLFGVNLFLFAGVFAAVIPNGD
jgi:hypothetical protein